MEKPSPFNRKLAPSSCPNGLQLFLPYALVWRTQLVWNPIWWIRGRKGFGVEWLVLGMMMDPRRGCSPEMDAVKWQPLPAWRETDARRRERDVFLRLLICCTDQHIEEWSFHWSLQISFNPYHTSLDKAHWSHTPWLPRSTTSAARPLTSRRTATPTSARTPACRMEERPAHSWSLRSLHSDVGVARPRPRTTITWWTTWWSAPTDPALVSSRPQSRCPRHLQRCPILITLSWRGCSRRTEF